MSQNEEKSQLHGRHPELDNPKAQIVVAVEVDVDLNASRWLERPVEPAICAWIALGTSISVSILNGGPPGLIFGLIVAFVYYAFIGLSLAELASSVPSAGGVYHWATICSVPQWGRMVGFFTGWINFVGWMLDLASLIQITANITIQMYATYHPEYVQEPWHTYITYILITWLCTAIVIFANLLMFFVIVGGIVTIIVLAMPKMHASSHFFWASFTENNLTGWSGGVAFLCGVLNGAFTIGTPDAITHIAEELPRPTRDLPVAIGLQIGLGFLSLFATGLGAIPLGSSTAFLDLTGSFVILSTVSYAIPFTSNILTGRKYLPQAYSVPTTTMSMNYNSVILVGVIALTGIWWVIYGLRNYPGARVTRLYIHEGIEVVPIPQSYEGIEVLPTPQSKDKKGMPLTTTTPLS
ncbi:amino acid permease-domain-containing protein [Lipomyces doorenjongii]